jgi:hypothetical protein
MKRIAFILMLGCFFSISLMALPGDNQEKKFLYNDAGRRDPFYPLIGTDGRILVAHNTTAKIGDLQLEGILWDEGGNSLAIINNQILAKGETIGAFKIIEITKVKVVLSKDNKKSILKLSDKDEEEE